MSRVLLMHSCCALSMHWCCALSMPPDYEKDLLRFLNRGLLNHSYCALRLQTDRYVNSLLPMQHLRKHSVREW